MSLKILSFSSIVLGSVALIACSGASTDRSDGNTDLSAAVESQAPATDAPAPACYSPGDAPELFTPFTAAATGTACNADLLKGYFEACYTNEATKDTCAAWFNGAGANDCGACFRTWSRERPDAQGQPTGLPLPNGNACIGKQLGTCANDVARFSQCSTAVCTSCTTAADATACHGAAGPGACNAYQGASNACVQAHQTELAVCVPPTAAQIQANPQAGSQYLIRFYAGACIDPKAWVPAAPPAASP